ncbi:MAG TPA: helix-turn-helix transcriptional regulator [Solirubrobacterales bacterium]|jgi:transcriptional regulator with XRE-family HTH domain
MWGAEEVQPSPSTHYTFAQRFGGNLARQRRAAGISQELLAELAALHRTAVGQIERGERVARTDTLVKLCSSLEVDPNVLLSGLLWVPPTISTGRFEYPAGPDGTT